MKQIVIPVAPVAKPRMTKRDRWKGRPVVEKYFAFRDQVQLHLPADWKFPASGARVTFFVPMPKSWTKKKKRQMESKPHQKRPDIDNFVKGLLDAACKEDNYVWDLRATKLLTKPGKGCIVIEYE